MIKKTILIVEDEEKLRNLIISYLSDKYNIFEAQDGQEAYQIFCEEHIDLVISDIMMPNMDGWELLKQIRAISTVPYILLTALDDEVSQIKGYDLTVDDYITKPFSLNILTKKVDAIFRRDSVAFEKKGVIEAGILRVDTVGKSVYVNDEETHLMPKEYDLLLFFLENQGEALNRDYILNTIWGLDYDGDERVVDTHIKKLRKKIGDASTYIKTVFGTGYKFQIDE
ncbi:two-component system response regulator ResD [Bacilli bacterium PM5-3]|nr:two-component system response regulator ResD [Bacilli bacterium PM5-3]MDH6603529.1 two-component system response regulator ResD [Bacilli bacterium PM5-9]